MLSALLASLRLSSPPRDRSAQQTDDDGEINWLGSLPDELLSAILSICEAPTLYSTVPAVSKSLQVLASSQREWEQRLGSLFPLCPCQPADDARKAFHMAATGATTFPVQILNRHCSPGTYGSAQWASGRYADEHGCTIEVRTRAGDASFVPSERVRQISGHSEFHTSLETFEVLQHGMVVELQWKKSEQSARYTQWFALVERVLSPDQVRLYFPQYGERGMGGSPSSLTGTSVLHRLRTTHMHGGVAGGVRIPTLTEVEQWWRVLETSALDQEEACVRNGMATTSDLNGIRACFKRNLPQEQPALSLRLARRAAPMATP